VVILPAKRFGPAEIERLAAILEKAHGGIGEEDGAASAALPAACHQHWRSLSASSHALPPESLARLGRAIAASSARGSSAQQRPHGPALVGLAIGDESTGDDGIRALCVDGFLSVPPNASASFLSLERLDLSHKGMTGLGLADVVASLRQSQNLRQLNLSRNDFASAVEALEPLWKSHEEGGDGGGCRCWFPALEDLDLSHCRLEPAFVDEFFQRLGRPTPATTATTTAATHPPLLRLALAGNPSLADSGVMAVWEWQWDRLIELDASSCGLGDGCVLGMCHQLQNAPDEGGRECPLHVLKVSDNSIGSAGAEMLGTWLGSSPSFLPRLAELHVARNPLGGDGVRALAHGLKRRHSKPPSAHESGDGAPLLRRVRLLDASSTECDDAQAALVAIKDSGVETLLLHGNRLGVRKEQDNGPSTSGFELLAQALRGGHPTIRYLDLSQNGADQLSVVTLLESLVMDDGAGAGAGADPTSTPAASQNEGGIGTGIGPSVLTTLVLGGSEVGPGVDAAVELAQRRHPRLVVPRR
jgi:Leucine Rich repeat